MPSIRDLTVAIRQRPGIEAVVVLGRDGLLIDAQSTIPVNAEDLAARIPGLVASADEIGHTTQRGEMRLSLVEHEFGYAIVSSIGDDALLCVLTDPSADLGMLLYDVRRHRQAIAAIL